MIVEDLRDSFTKARVYEVVRVQVECTRSKAHGNGEVN